MRPLGVFAWVGLLCASSACSFFGKVPPLRPRYFEAEAEASSRPGAPANPDAPALRVGHVVGATHLRELIAYHVAEHELGFYEQRRWTERPESYVRRALASALYEERGLKNTPSGAAPTLEVELTDFSELLEPTHAVRVRMRVLLVDQRAVRFERTFLVEQPVQKGDDFSLVPAAMSEALARCVDQVADAVQSELSAPK